MASPRKTPPCSKGSTLHETSPGKCQHLTVLECFLAEINGTPVKPAPGSNHASQLELLKRKLVEVQETDCSFCVLGTGFSVKPAQQFRDSNDGLGIDLYTEFHPDRRPSGRFTVVLEKDPGRPHRAGIEAFSDAIKAAFQPHGKLHDDAETAIDWTFCHKEEGQEEIRELWGQKTPDSAFVPLPLEDGFAASMVGEHAFKHESVNQLAVECNFHLEMTPAEVAWGMMTGTAEDSNRLWQDPRQDLFAFQEHPDVDLRVVSGPLRYGATSNCNRARLSKYNLKVRERLLVKGRAHAGANNGYKHVDLFEVAQHSKRHLLIGKGAVSPQVITDRCWKARHREVLEFASSNGFIRQKDLSKELRDKLFIQMGSDL